MKRGTEIDLERLRRYAARHAVSMERLSELPDRPFLYRLKRPWRDGI
ncbi:MAG: transposase [Acidobacteriaceae bacterium]|nr:transposase [Acidobacteriaceae bacterium]MBV9501107.1 transposase [Acidobacteriaceae bacterium]